MSVSVIRLSVFWALNALNVESPIKKPIMALSISTTLTPYALLKVEVASPA